MRIRRVGAIHYQHGIPFPSAVWREFKSSTLSIISECEFKSHDVSSCLSTAEFLKAALVKSIVPAYCRVSIKLKGSIMKENPPASGATPKMGRKIEKKT